LFLNLKVDAIITNFRLCVNVDYLILLYEFFVESLPLSNDLKENDEKLKKSKKELIEEKLDKIKTFANDDSQSKDEKQSIIVRIKLDSPQFIVYENQFELKKTNCLILEVTIKKKLKNKNYYDSFF
jgi:hypothetical protein